MVAQNGSYVSYRGKDIYVQNMEYDSNTGDIFLSVYRGHKPKFMNHNYFRIAGKQMPTETDLIGKNMRGNILSLWRLSQSEGMLFRSIAHI